jgi:hypothetical protein
MGYLSTDQVPPGLIELATRPFENVGLLLLSEALFMGTPKTKIEIVYYYLSLIEFQVHTRVLQNVLHRVLSIADEDIPVTNG